MDSSNIIELMLSKLGYSDDLIKEKTHLLTVNAYIGLFTSLKTLLSPENNLTLNTVIQKYIKDKNPYNLESLSKQFKESTKSVDQALLKEKFTEAELKALQDFWNKENLTDEKRAELRQMYSNHLDSATPEVKSANSSFEAKFGNII